MRVSLTSSVHSGAYLVVCIKKKTVFSYSSLEGTECSNNVGEGRGGSVVANPGLGFHILANKGRLLSFRP